MHEFLHHLVRWFVERWSQAPPLDPWHYDQAGFITPLVSAIIGIVAQVGQFIYEAGQLAFKTIESAVRFAVKGVSWITGVVRKGYGELLDGMGHTFTSVGRWLGNLYCDYQDLKSRLSYVFGPIVNFLKKVKQWYDLVWKRVVTPVLQLLQRFRKILAIFKFFHLKWAEKLDRDLAWLESKIAKNFLIVRQWLNLIGAWVNFLVDPLGAIRAFPMVAGFFGALNTTWSGLFGSQFTWFKPSSSGAGPTTSASVKMQQDLVEIKAGTGDSGDIYNRADELRRAVFAEMGVQK